jgi:pimeloyl-ACP methyl ester carboxylesterase
MSFLFADPLKLGPRVDGLLARFVRKGAMHEVGRFPTRFVELPGARVRVLDSGAAPKPCVVFVPDGPNVIEHYLKLIERLLPHVRVVCFDMPGFGFSLASPEYTHSLDHGAHAVAGVLDALGIARPTLAFSCANGLYALRVARLWPARVRSLFLSQTPSLLAMHAWTERVIPKPLRMPVLGQLVTRLGRQKFAAGWYERALPSHALAAPFQATARAALSRGAHFSLAGVVQGLSRDAQADIEHVTQPCTMLWGSADKSHRKTDPSSLLACSPSARVLPFAGVGHFPDLEQPERFAELLLEHLASLD